MAFELKPDRSMNTAQGFFRIRSVSAGSRCFYSKYNINGVTTYYFTERNSHRMPNYHRLDISANVVLKKNKNFSSELSFGLYNAYGRENPYIINFRDNKENPNIVEAVQTSLFRFIPSISYNFKLR